jgi:hypothetical protein
MSRSDVHTNKTSEETGNNADLLAAVDAGIEKMRQQLIGNGQEKGVGTIADLVRLLQLRKELEGDRPRHITARWIDEDEC